MKFLNQTHKTRFIELFAQDGTSIHDNERLSLLYIISGNDDLYYKRLHVYDFKKHKQLQEPESEEESKEYQIMQQIQSMIRMEIKEAIEKVFISAEPHIIQPAILEQIKNQGKEGDLYNKNRINSNKS